MDPRRAADLTATALHASWFCLRRELVLDTAAERADPFALVYAATSHGWLCEYRAARELTARALEAGHDQGAAGSEAFASEMLSEYEAALGDYDAAGAVWAEGALEAEEPLWYIGVDGAAWVLATSALARGDGETAASLLANADLDICQANYVPWTVGADMVEAHVRAGNPALAEAALRSLAPHARQAWARAALERARGMVA